MILKMMAKMMNEERRKINFLFACKIIEISLTPRKKTEDSQQIREEKKKKPNVKVIIRQDGNQHRILDQKAQHHVNI